MLYDISYQQTAAERYETDMNAQVRALIEAAGLRIFVESGGASLEVSPDDLGAEQSFIVDGTLAQINSISPMVAQVVKHPVSVDEVPEILQDEEPG